MSDVNYNNTTKTVASLTRYQFFATTSSGTTTSGTPSTYVDIGGVTGTVSTEAGTYMCLFRICSFGDVASPNSMTSFRLDVDAGSQFVTATSWQLFMASRFNRVPTVFIGYVTLTAGFHTIKAQFRNSDGAEGRADGNDSFQLELLRVA